MDSRFKNTAIGNPGWNPQFPRGGDIPSHMRTSKEDSGKE